MEKGTNITEETVTALHRVGENAQKAIDAMALVEEASRDQANSIDQVKMELSQISSIVQTNVATAEENSATSEEMSAQAATLHQEVSKFKLKSNHPRSNYGRAKEVISPSNHKLPLISRFRGSFLLLLNRFLIFKVHFS